MKFPNKCCRCGMCCLSEVCSIGQEHYRVEKYSKCPGLLFNGSIATCNIVDVIPIGDGCCIKAKAYKDGIEFNVADLPVIMKFGIVQDIKLKKILALNRKGERVCHAIK